MNLTEPEAGSDVGALRTRAVPADDGTWRITGQKIFITFGEHDLAENIIHLVLARVPDAPPGHEGYFVSSSCQSSSSTPTAHSGPATTCAASPSSTSSESTPAPPASCPTGTKGAPSAT